VYSQHDPLQTECTDDRNSVALCNLVKHEYALPQEYQNFDSLNHVHDNLEFYGGSVSLSDYCPYIQGELNLFLIKTNCII